MSFPALDLPTFSARTIMPPGDIAIVEGNSPSFTVQRIASQTSALYARLRKRYAKTIPFGQNPPALIASGTTPPPVVLTGRPTMGAYLVVLQVTTGGPQGTAVFKWSSNGGGTWTENIVTGSSVVLGATGMSAMFPQGNYGTDNTYTAAPPIPEAFLEWLTVLVTLDLYWKRGTNPQDPALASLTERRTEVLADVKEAADGQAGLFDLPLSEDEPSAISSGAPMAYSEASPYVGQQMRAYQGRHEDARGRGSFT